jgi:hypothetical protein
VKQITQGNYNPYEPHPESWFHWAIYADGPLAQITAYAGWWRDDEIPQRITAEKAGQPLMYELDGPDRYRFVGDGTWPEDEPLAETAP